MPRSVPLATATSVMPQALCSAFTASYNYACEVNEFPSGESIRWPDVSTARRSWRLTRKLTAAELATLRTFYESVGTGPFHYYEQISPFAYDPTGSDDTNRYTVRFDGKWQQTQSRGPLTEVQISLVQIAGTLPDAEIMDYSNSNASGLLVI